MGSVFQRYRRLGLILVSFLASFLAACSGAGAGGDGGGAGDVQITGRLAGLVTGNRVGAPLGGSSLSSAVVTVGALPIIGGELDIEAIEETPVSGDGSFALNVPTEPGIEHVLLVRGPEDGVGVEQEIGFIELPAGSDQSNAGWELDGATAGTTLDLGALSGTGGTFLPETTADQLYSLLGAEQAEQLFAAYRDDILKLASNEYLNADAQLGMWTNQYFGGTLDNAINTWSAPEDAVPLDDYSFGFNLEGQGADPLTWDDFADGTNVFEIVPPVTVFESFGQTFGPDAPIRSDEYWPNGGDFGQINGLGFAGPPPDGPWIVSINGVTDSVYDVGTSNPFDEDGQFLYFIPSIFVSVGGDNVIDGVELRMLIWDFEANDYLEITDETELPFEYTLTFRAVRLPSGTGEIAGDIGDTLGELLPLDVPEDVYWTEVDGQYQIHVITITYSLGVTFDINFWRTNDNL